MIKFNLLKINKPNNSLKELLHMYYDNVVYLTRDDLYFSYSDKSIRDIIVYNFMSFKENRELLYKSDMIIFVDGECCNIFKNRSGKIGLYKTETLHNKLINGIYY
jgi:hypothetical protein